jgi:hypothetical protein
VNNNEYFIVVARAVKLELPQQVQANVKSVYFKQVSTMDLNESMVDRQVAT